jgi:hypothetical protein
MSQRHLDETSYRDLLSGALRGEAAAELAGHLEEGCDACEAFLAARGPDPIDGAADRALAHLTQGGSPGNDLEYARIQRSLGGGRRVWRGMAVAAAAAVALAGVAVTVDRAGRPAHEAWDGLKGAEAPVAARLRFSVVLSGPRGAELERGATGAVVPAEASLLFRVETAGPTALALVRIGAGDSELVWAGSAAAAGAMDLELAGRPAAFPLQGLSGRQRFALLAAPVLGPDRIEEARRQLASWRADRAPAQAVGLDLVEVTVR